MSRKIRFNLAATEFAAELLRQCRLSSRFRSRFMTERPGWESSRFHGVCVPLEEALAVGRNHGFADIAFDQVKDLLAPLTHYVFEEIEIETSEVKALNREFRAAAALDFLKGNIARTEDDLPYYQAAFADEEFKAIKDAVSGLKRILTLPEPQRSTEARAALADSLSTIEVEEEGAYRDLLGQLERVLDGDSDSVVMKARHEARVFDFLKTPS